MAEFEVGGIRYSAGKMRDARLQVHVLRRMGPAASTALAASITVFAKGSGAREEAANDDDVQDKVGDAREAFTSGVQEKFNASSMDEIAGVIHKIMTEVSAMSDASWDYIQDACLAVVKRQQANGTWAPVLEPRTKQMLFQDMDYKAILLCVFHALKENFTDFFPAMPSTSGGTPKAPPN